MQMLSFCNIHIVCKGTKTAVTNDQVYMTD